MPGGWGEFKVPANTLSGAPGATAKLSTGLGDGAMPAWASTQLGNNSTLRPNKIVVHINNGERRTIVRADLHHK